MHRYHAVTSLAAASLTLGALQGCANAPAKPAPSTKLPEFIEMQPESLRPYLQQLYAEGERNAVLNFNRLGIAAMVQGQPALARKAFDQSIQRIEAVRTKGQDLEAAKSKFGVEASKDFKGEPYEKAMVYYYRGILYSMDGDYSNGAASFAQANVEDSVAESERYQADFASAKLLQSWALRCNGEQATSDEVYRQAVELRPELKAIDFRRPGLLVVEAGKAPRKVGTGKYKERLTWEEGGGNPPALTLQAAPETSVPLVNGEDLYFQASTRGGRPVEYLLQGKVNFREGAGTAAGVGSAVAMAGLVNAEIQQRSGNFQAAATSGYLSLAGSLFGLISSVVEQNTTPAADTRAWDSLPGTIWLSAPETGLSSMPQWRVGGGTGEPAAPGLVGRGERCALAWARLAPLPAPVPNPAVAIDNSAEAVARLRQFQAALPTLL